jgi:integrase
MGGKVGNLEPVSSPPRDLRGLQVPRIGAAVETNEPGEPFTIVDAAGEPVEAVSEFMREFTAGDMTSASCRSYAHDLLRWWRFLAAVGVAWDQAQRTDVRDLVLWLRQASNPQRERSRSGGPGPGSINPRTGKRHLAEGYAPATINHQLAVLSTFYDFHLAAGRGPPVNPVPPAGRGFERLNAHHNPMHPYGPHRRGNYRQKIPARLPRGIPDELFNELFAAMTCNRDRAILATYVSSGARASELLGVRCGDVDFGRQTITRRRQGHPRAGRNASLG